MKSFNYVITDEVGIHAKDRRDFGEGGEKIRLNDYDCKRREKPDASQADGLMD